MSPYTRPSIAPRVFVDADGEIIDYGHRWSDSPPTEAYSVTVHPERYAPLHAVAAALIDHLRNTYDVGSTKALMSPPAFSQHRAGMCRARCGCVHAIRSALR